MKLSLRYFAGIREQLGRDGEALESVSDVATVAALRQLLMARGEIWQQALSEKRVLRVAVNQDMAGPETLLRDGDEVAFFPPVTGG